MQYIIKFLITFIVFMGIDLIWLGIVARKLYGHFLGHLLKSPPNWGVAFLFYTIFIVGLIIIAVEPGIASKSIRKATIMGGLFGFFTYATYDLTNWATLKNWPVGIVPIDILWGMVLSASVAGISTWLYLIIQKSA